MKIHTSYFAVLARVKNPIAICGKSPSFYHGPEFKALAPKWSFLRDWKDGKITDSDYVREYNKLVLDVLDPHEVVKQLQQFYPEEDEVTLLCYERPADFCHRHLVADWLIQAGYPVCEVLMR